MYSSFAKSDDLARRMFLAGAAKSLLGVGGFALSNRELTAATHSPSTSTKPSAKSVIYLYMTGGMSHLDTLDPKPGASTQGPVETLNTNVTGMHVSEYLPNLAKVADKIAILNSLSSTQGAHAQGRYHMHTSYFLRGTIQHPDLGAYSASLLPPLNKTLPANVKIGGNSSGLGAGFLEKKYAALPIGDPGSGLQHSTLPRRVDGNRFLRRLARVERMNEKFRHAYDSQAVRAHTSMYDEAVKLMKSNDLAAFDLGAENQTTRDRYGQERFAQGVLLARRLVEHGVRFVEVDFGGWDTHVDNFGRVAEQAATLDQALAALVGDLDERGMLQETLVVLATEFGRTPEIITARNNGRNHYPKAFSCLLAGGGIRGGQVFGKTDPEGREVIEQQLTVPDFNATIAFAMGLPWQEEIMSPTRRPFKVANDGQPVIELFG